MSDTSAVSARWTLFHRLCTRPYSGGFMRWCPAGFTGLLREVNASFVEHGRGLAFDDSWGWAEIDMNRPDTWDALANEPRIHEGLLREPRELPISYASYSRVDRVLLSHFSDVYTYRAQCLDFLVRSCSGDPTRFLRALSPAEARLLSTALDRDWVGDLVPIKVPADGSQGPAVVGGESID